MSDAYVRGMDNQPEYAAFVDTIGDVKPDQFTMCRTWTAHDLVAHLAAGAAEIVKNVSAFNRGGAEAVPETLGLDERERAFRAKPWEELCDELRRNQDELDAALNEALAVDPASVTPWAGREMPIAAFVSHARSEYAVHRWDLVGDDDISLALLSEPSLTQHAVLALGQVLVAAGTAGPRDAFRLTTPDQPGIVASIEGLVFDDFDYEEADISGDSAARLLLLWGRQPQAPCRLRAISGGQRYRQLRALLGGY